MVFPTELYLQVACTWNHLFSSRTRSFLNKLGDSETIKNAMDAGARQLRLIYLTNDTLLELDSTI